MEESIKKLLYKMLIKYRIAESIDNGKNKQLNEKWTSSIVLEKKNMTDFDVRNTLVRCSRILEEDQEKHIYVAMIILPGIGRREVLVVTKRTEDSVSVATYAKEGLISQHMADKAIALFQENFMKTIK